MRKGIYFLSLLFLFLSFNVFAMQPDWRVQTVAILSDPTFVYLLILLAVYGLFFEFSSPGMIIPGFIGLIALLLVMYSFQLMPINYAGLTVLLIGLVCMVLEVYAFSFGILGLGGALCFILGSIMLFDRQSVDLVVILPLILSMSVITLGFFFMVFSISLRSYQKPVVTGKEGLIHSEGIVISVHDKKILVRVLGEIWHATSTSSLHPSDRITISKVDGMLLHVEPVQAENKNHGVT